MPRIQVQDEILEYLQEKGHVGASREEFNARFGSSAYPYTVLLNLCKTGKVSKISNRWYYGGPLQWLAEVDVNSWIHLLTPSIKASRSPNFTWGAQMDMNELKADAEQGLLLYFLYCQLAHLPFPIYKGEMTKAEREEAYSRILETLKKYIIQ